MNLQNLVEDSSFESSHKQIFDVAKQHNFNYEILDLNTQIRIKQKTSEIKVLIRQTAKNIVEVGQKLSEVKQQLKHGEFRNWLKTEFNLSISSATKFMQVSEKFKSVNFTHFNFSASALYALAAPSTPDSAREYALRLASKGENITYSKARQIVDQHKKLTEINDYQHNQSNLNNTSQSNARVISSQTKVTQQDDAMEPDKSVQIIEIRQENQKRIEDRVRDFEIVYAGTHIAVKGSPKDLTVLFKKMQENPQFAEDIFKQAKLLSE